MARHKSHDKKDDKKKKKGSQLVIRLEKEERKAFVSLCETLDTSAAREIRRFMRDFVAAHHPAETSPPESTEIIEADPVAAAPVEEVAAKAETPKPEKRKRKA